MALPAQLHRFLASAASVGGGDSLEAGATGVLGFGIPQLDEVLPDRGLPRGSVVELSVAGGALATSVALSACRAAQEEGALRCAQPSWCAFVDPTSTLHAPGVQQAGVALERLLVVRPPAEALGRIVVRLSEARAFAVLAVDTRGVPGALLQTPLGNFARVVRRAALAVEGSASVVLLITDSEAPRPLPLPVGLRLELRRSNDRELVLRVAKEKRGRISPPRSVAWVRSGFGATGYGHTG